MSSKWTDEQLSAIEERGCNLLVAAAAGAGKTAVLVERILRRITEKEAPVDIDRLLVVTFTNAAAAEMRERVGDAILKELEKSPDSKALQKQLLLLQRASITTIHSFCLEVIRNNFHCIDLDPAFRIADQTEGELLKYEALEELFEDKYEQEEQDAGFLELVECYGGSKDDSALQGIVLEIFDFIQSNPWPDKWISDAASAYRSYAEEDFMKSKWAKTLLTIIMIELNGMRSSLLNALQLSSSTEGLEGYAETIKSDLAGLDSLIVCCNSSKSDWDSLYDTFAELSFDRLKSASKDADKRVQEHVKDIRGDIKDRLKKIREDVLYAKNSSISDELKGVYPILESLGSLVKDFGKKFAEKKKEKGIIDFNDIEHFCLRILVEEQEEGIKHPSKIALKLRVRFDEIYIDEYQDSNEVQEEILCTISRNDSEHPNLFMVGDIKQSIYRFRQAKPELFSAKYETYPIESGGRSRKILLNKNFRSREEVLASVNFVFKTIMSKNVGEVYYDDNEALNVGFSYEEVEDKEALTVELNLVDLKDEADSEKDIEATDEELADSQEGLQLEEESLTSIQTEARMIAKRIQELIKPEGSFKIYDKAENCYRQPRYSDIVILLRTTRGWAEVFSEELALMNIPVFADMGSGYFKTLEVSTMMALLQIIDNPIQDIPLLAVLRSPIAGFTAEELIDIRMSDKAAAFYDALKKASEGTTELAVKSKAFIERLNSWRDKAQYTSTDELIWQLYTDTGYYSFVGAMTGGIQRQANLRVLFERARQFEDTSYKGLFNFINFVNKLKSNSGDMGSAKTIGEHENVVRIMSIHKSKGLEFPIVFAAGMCKSFNLMDMNKSIILHQELGFGMDYISRERRISYATAAKHAIRYKIKLESLSEEMRILYVAMTRAREKLILTGAAKNLKGSAVKWCSLGWSPEGMISDYQVLKGRSYMDWICAALVRHEHGSTIRELGGVEEALSYDIVPDDSKWTIKLFKKSEFVKAVEGVSEEGDDSFLNKLQGYMEEFALLDSPVDLEAAGAIAKRLEWSYPYSAAQKLPVKLTVTELKRLFNTELDSEYLGMYIPQLTKRPKFMEETKLMTAAEKGTVMHFAMQHLELERVSSVEQISEQLQAMLLMELLNENQIKSINPKKLFAFFESTLGKRLLESKKAYREIPFNMELPCEEFYKELPKEQYKDHSILLQGVIDCCFEEDGGLVLIDYKTDFVPDGDTSIIKERYELQLRYYARALEKITGMPVKESYIYMFWNGEAVEL